RAAEEPAGARAAAAEREDRESEQQEEKTGLSHVASAKGVGRTTWLYERNRSGPSHPKERALSYRFAAFSAKSSAPASLCGIFSRLCAGWGESGGGMFLEGAVAMSAQMTALTAETRAESGKGAARRLRNAGQIPAVAYGKGKPAKTLAVVPKDVVVILKSEH